MKAKYAIWNTVTHQWWFGGVWMIAMARQYSKLEYAEAAQCRLQDNHPEWGGKDSETVIRRVDDESLIREITDAISYVWAAIRDDWMTAVMEDNGAFHINSKELVEACCSSGRLATYGYWEAHSAMQLLLERDGWNGFCLSVAQRIAPRLWS